MAKRDYYETLGLAAGRASRTSNRRSAGSPRNAIPTAIPATRRAEHELQGAERGLRGPEGSAEARGLRPVRPCRVRRRARAAARGFGPDFASSMSDIFDDLFGEFMGGRRGGAASAAARERGADLRYNMEITLDRGVRRQDGADPRADQRHLRNLHGHRRQGRHQADRRARPAAAPARCARARASSPSSAPALSCQGRGEIIDDPCRACSGSGPRHQGAHALGQHPGGRRGRHAHPACGRGRSGPARRTGRRPLHLPLDQAARVLPARRRRHLLPRADRDDDGRARRADRGADRRRRGRRASRFPKAPRPASSSA